jgi:hypothetical protein
MAAIWLVGSVHRFLRNREQLANPPVSLDLGEAAVVADHVVAQLKERGDPWQLENAVESDSPPRPTWSS